MTDNEFRALPKAENYVRLPDSLRADLVAEFATENGMERPSWGDLYRPRRFPDYLRRHAYVRQAIQTQDQLARAIYDVCLRLQAEGIGYADVTVTPSETLASNLALILAGLGEGIRCARHRGLPKVGICLNYYVAKDENAEAILITLDQLARSSPEFVKAVGLTLTEPRQEYLSLLVAFRRAHEQGLKTVFCFSGQFDDVDLEVATLVASSEVDLVVLDRGELGNVDALEWVGDLGGPLALCPILGAGQPQANEALLFERLQAADVQFTINTGAPSFRGVTLPEVYSRCQQAFDWGIEECKSVAEASIRASFADADTKKRLLKKLNAWNG